MKTMSASRLVALAAIGVGVSASSASARANFNETEPNDTYATANIIGPLSAGDTITGNSTSTTGAGVDYFNVSIAPAAPAIYRHRLVITTSGAAGHAGSFRGRSQVAAPADTLPGTPWDGVVGSQGTAESTLQTSSTTTTPARFNQWYGFGKGERLVYRVNGGSTTTADYVATMETVAVVPTSIGSFAPGQISISTFGQGHTSDTDMWVYDANFNPILGYGNDDEAVLGGSPGTGASLQSFLSRSYAPGTYYLALTNFNLSNSLASPSDDDFRTGALHEFAGVVTNSSTTVNLNLTFTISDSLGGSVQVPNTKAGAYDINWFQFTVVPTPGTGTLFGLAGLIAARRRR